MPIQTKEIVPASQPRCKICQDVGRRSDVDAMLVQPGVSARAVAKEFGFHVSSVYRHMPHIGAALETARSLREVESVGELYKRVKERAVSLMELSERAESAGQWTAAVAARAEARKHEEMLAKFAQSPGFRDALPATQINAPEARILVTSGEPGK